MCEISSVRRILSVALLAFACQGQPARGQTAPPGEAAEPGPATSSIPTVWDLAIRGGVFMIPIALCSVVVVTVSIERLIALRRSRIIPPDLIQGLEDIAAPESKLHARAAFKLCQQYPSPMSEVLSAGLQKLGRPHQEVEKAVEDAGARTTAKLLGRIRHLNICTSVAPLLGLIGTVQGMIMAFIVTSTTAATGAAKAQELAQGIYTALVTTFAGLCVAVLSVVCAHLFEGRVERLLGAMEEVMLRLLPMLERYEGRSKKTSAKVNSTAQPKPIAEPVLAASAPPRGREKQNS